MNSNQQLIIKFYSSFKQLDVQGMQACYHEDIIFSDPAFPQLKGKEAGAMWHMLIDTLKKNKDDWRLDFSDVEANDENGTALWEAHYTFSLTGRKIHNVISAKFKFKDGKIIQHDDSFDFYRWTKMAFGITGIILGWTPFFKRKLQSKTKARLTSFMKRPN